MPTKHPEVYQSGQEITEHVDPVRERGTEVSLFEEEDIFISHVGLQDFPNGSE